MIDLGGGDIELGNPSFYIAQFLALPAKARILCFRFIIIEYTLASKDFGP
jgi:hypothetical protein